MNLRIILFILFCLSYPVLYPLTAYFSDCQSYPHIHRPLVQQIAKHNPDYVFIGGDITINGTLQSQYDAFFDAMKPLTQNNVEIFPTMGNHDKDVTLFLKNFPNVDSLTYYSVDKDGIVWIILNSNIVLAPDSKQYNWMIETLENNKNRSVVIMMHHPIFSSGKYGSYKGLDMLLPPIFKKYSVAAVFCGHDHIYERSEKDGIYYIVFGGGGGPLYDKASRNDYSQLFLKTHGFLILKPEDNTMKVTAYDLDGAKIDEFDFILKTTLEQEEKQ